MKKIIAITLTLALSLALLAACGGNSETTESPTNTPNGTGTPTNNFDTNQAIHVITRESGSGTRGAFEDMFDIDISGQATIIQSTGGVREAVAGDIRAISYISLGSMRPEVRAVNIDGAAATVENIVSGEYGIFRPFLLAHQDDLSDAAQDFLNFILSAEGQEIINNGFIGTVDGALPFESNGATGRVEVDGSTSVGPLMAQLREAYLAIRPDANIQLNEGGTGAGINGAIEGNVDLGMASRDLRATEDIGYTLIALDAIAVIVHPDNPITNLTSEQVATIFGETNTRWSDVF